MKKNSEQSWRYCVLCGVGSLLFFVAIAQARLLDVKLATLVEKSEFIGYGKSTQTVLSPSRVSFRAEQVLKGKNLPKSAEVVLCNEPNEVETYDLRNIDTAYLVFASSDGDCYRPVHGLRSIVKVVAGSASTIAIIDQPASQPIDEFIKKIQGNLK